MTPDILVLAVLTFAAALALIALYAKARRDSIADDYPHEISDGED